MGGLLAGRSAWRPETVCGRLVLQPRLRVVHEVRGGLFGGEWQSGIFAGTLRSVTVSDPPAGPAPRPILASGPVVLRPPQPEDVEARVSYGRHPEIVRMYGGVLPEPVALSREAAQRWYAEICADPLSWVIEAEGRCVGAVRLHSLIDQDRRARLAIGLFHPDLLGGGIGTLATRLLLQHAFGTMQLHRVDLRVLAFNGRAIRCYEKCGFLREGVERESAWVDGAWADDVLMGILEDEYHALASTWEF